MPIDVLDPGVCHAHSTSNLRINTNFLKDKTKTPTEGGKQELVSKLDSFITVPYTVVDHTAGIRPTVKDRRPLVGKHQKHQNLAVLNGLGTRGVIIAPIASKALYNHLEHDLPIDKELSIDRFDLPS